MSKKYDVDFLIKKARTDILRNHPFFSEVMLILKYQLTESVPSAATDGQTVYFNPKFIESIVKETATSVDVKNLVFAYCHELLHAILKHPEHSRRFPKLDQLLLNVAQDILINELLITSGFVIDNDFKQSLMFKDKFEELRNIDVTKLTSIEIYELIAKRLKQKLSSISSGRTKDSSDKSESGSGSNIDDILDNPEEFNKAVDDLEKQGKISKDEKEAIKHAYEEYRREKELDERLSEEEKKKLEKKIKDAVIKGYINAKERGTITAAIEKIMEHVFKRVRNWKQILREELLEDIKGDFTWVKISDTLQSLHAAGYRNIGNLPSIDRDYGIPKIVIGIDTSGSISDNDYRDFLNEVYSILTTANVKDYTIVLWEHEVTAILRSRNGVVKKTLEELKKRKGYGGTTLRSFIKWAEKNARNSIAIILTDGYFEEDIMPKELMIFKKVIFVLTKDSNYANVKKLESRKIKILMM